MILKRSRGLRKSCTLWTYLKQYVLFSVRPDAIRRSGNADHLPPHDGILSSVKPTTRLRRTGIFSVHRRHALAERVLLHHDHKVRAHSASDDQRVIQSRRSRRLLVRSYLRGTAFVGPVDCGTAHGLHVGRLLALASLSQKLMLSIRIK